MKCFDGALCIVVCDGLILALALLTKDFETIVYFVNWKTS